MPHELTASGRGGSGACTPIFFELRRMDATIALQGEGGLDGATLNERAFVLRFRAPDDDDRLLVVNLGADIDLVAVAEPLVAPPPQPASASWAVLWSSEAAAYGGGGTPSWQRDRWPVPGHAALLLGPGSRRSDDGQR